MLYYLFPGKRWAFLLGIGYGIGMAYASCDYELNAKYELPPCKKKDSKTKKSSNDDIWNAK